MSPVEELYFPGSFADVGVDTVLASSWKQDFPEGSLEGMQTQPLPLLSAACNMHAVVEPLPLQYVGKGVTSKPDGWWNGKPGSLMPTSLLLVIQIKKNACSPCLNLPQSLTHYLI